jgi:hypothetical protein
VALPKRGAQGGRMFLRLEPTRDATRLRRWLIEATKGKRSRFNAWARLTARNAGDFIADAVKDRIPRSSDELVAYRESIKVFDVKDVRTGGKKLVPVAIVSDPRATVMGDDDATKVALWVDPAPIGRFNPAVDILEKFAPWTPDTLPWWPPSGVADIVSQKVRDDEFVAIRDARTRDLPRVVSALTRAGVRARKPKKNDYKGRRVMSGVALMALRMEFGVPGAPSDSPHWRPAIRDLKRRGVKLIMAGRRGPWRNAKRVMMDPNFASWKIVPRRRTIFDVETLKRDVGPFVRALRLSQIG